MEITQQHLAELLQYDPETGVFTWLVSRGNARRGAIAGTKHPAGYVVIVLLGRKYRAHHLAWLATTGSLPDGQLDHKNTNRADNRISNLRISSQRQNTYNSSLRSNNKSGVKGVHWHQSSGLWRAVITVEGKKIYLGKFEELSQAVAVIEHARSEHHREFARH